MHFKFKTIKEAYKALSHIYSIIDEYGVITLEDVKDIADWRNVCYTDNKVGWCNRNDFYVVGYTVYAKHEPYTIENPEYVKCDRCHYDDMKEKENLAVCKIEHSIDLLIRAGYSYGDDIVQSLRDVLDSLK